MEEADAKSKEFTANALLLQQKNSERYTRIAEAMEKELPALQKAKSYDDLCRFYDKWTHELAESLLQAPQ